MIIKGHKGRKWNATQDELGVERAHSTWGAPPGSVYAYVRDDAIILTPANARRLAAALLKIAGAP